MYGACELKSMQHIQNDILTNKINNEALVNKLNKDDYIYKINDKSCRHDTYNFFFI